VYIIVQWSGRMKTTTDLPSDFILSYTGCREVAISASTISLEMTQTGRKIMIIPPAQHSPCLEETFEGCIESGGRIGSRLKSLLSF
jgi:hypothetical protein